MPYDPPPPTESNVCQHTSGDWCRYVQPRYLAEEKNPRIDLLLLPLPRLVNSGWRYGAIGIECKASQKKLGPIVAQCEDYMRAAFAPPPWGLDVMCKWVFVWPLQEFAGDLASLMTSNRIGGAWGHRYCLLRLKTACGNILEVDPTPDATGQYPFRIGKIAAGFKTGSR